ncbi:homoserine kinase [Capsaspora owczarzaki ATCC 30864]|uniref:homoserine kinase n=1 Tax=Capsaspora owczarzaki (strain ATCC 30864) TaxID=595528 RepID=UPI00035216A6|nr:homoserine kinase [Capsaspora owczarzaki ATCC 30864]|eukprot:XP_004345194.2 homoserine kinase [Capsaspora owczarzaki ATCC 30864]
MPVERNRVVVRVPATTANMGPGFDCIGMALGIFNELIVERSDAFAMEIIGEGQAELPRDASNLVVVGVEAAFRIAGKTTPTLSYVLKNAIPFARGLGSSSAAIVAGLLAGLTLAGHELSVQQDEELLNIAADLEGHPDNVAPCIYGGLQIGVHTGRRWMSTRVSVPHGLQAVLFVPDTPMETATARAVLLPTIQRSEAVFNIGRAAMLVHAFNTGRLDKLQEATRDALHQPQRSGIMPVLFPVIDAAIAAGAHGAFLSGAGSTILALTSGRRGDVYVQRSDERKEKEVSDAMLAAARAHNMPGKIYVTHPVELGAHVVSVEPADASNSQSV